MPFLIAVSLSITIHPNNILPLDCQNTSFTLCNRPDDSIENDDPSKSITHVRVVMIVSSRIYFDTCDGFTPYNTSSG